MHVLAAAATLGALTGGRTFAVSALFARALSDVAPNAASGPLTGRLASGTAARALTGLALAELLVDKLPIIGPRTEPLPLLARAVAGGVAGAASAELLGSAKTLPVLAGAGAALVGAHLAYHLRRRIRRKADVADTVVAIAEDAAVIGIGAEVVEDLIEDALARAARHGHRGSSVGAAG